MGSGPEQPSRVRRCVTAVNFQATSDGGEGEQEAAERELLVLSMGSTILRKHPTRSRCGAASCGGHQSSRTSAVLYLPRVAAPAVLLQSIRDGIALLTWRADTFAHAEGRDEASGRYRGLRAGQMVSVSADGPGVLVRPEVAARQMDAETEAATAPAPDTAPDGSPATTPSGPGLTVSGATPGAAAVATQRLTRFHGTVSLDPVRAGRDASRIADEVISHLVGQVARGGYGGAGNRGFVAQGVLPTRASGSDGDSGLKSSTDSKGEQTALRTDISAGGASGRKHHPRTERALPVEVENQRSSHWDRKQLVFSSWENRAWHCELDFVATRAEFDAHVGTSQR